jgi:hypothetical protein
MLGAHDSIDLGPSTEYAKEMRKWEANHTKYGAPGRPFTYKEFPKRLYKAEWDSDGIKMVDAQNAGNADEQRNLESRGFHARQEDAIEAVRRVQTEHGRLAAERNYEIQHGRISERAAAEVRAAETEHGARHLPEVKEKPMRRKRRTKAEMLAAAK